MIKTVTYEKTGNVRTQSGDMAIDITLSDIDDRKGAIDIVTSGGEGMAAGNVAQSLGAAVRTALERISENSGEPIELLALILLNQFGRG